MNTTIVRTRCQAKCGMKFIMEETNYEFCDDIWNIIKEFAGIYNYSIDWKRKFSFYKALRIWSDPCIFEDENNVIKGAFAYNKRRLVEESEKGDNIETTARKIFWRKTVTPENKAQMMELLSKTFTRKTFKTSAEFKIGDEVMFWVKDGYIGGLLIDVTPKSYKVKMYQLRAFYNWNTEEYEDGYWDTRGSEIKIFKTNPRKLEILGIESF